MGCHDYESLKAHVGHKIECVSYRNEFRVEGNVAVECVDCHVVLMDYEYPYEDMFDENTVKKFEGKTLQELSEKLKIPKDNLMDFITMNDWSTCDMCDKIYSMGCGNFLSLDDNPDSWVCLDCHEKAVSK